MVLTQLRFYLRRQPYNEHIFLSDVKVLDDIVVELCPTVHEVDKKL